MKIRFELIRIVSILIAIGSLGYAGMSAISKSDEFRTGDYDLSGGMNKSLIWFGCSTAVFIVTGLIQRRLK